MKECIALTAWVPPALLAALAFGVSIGTFVRLGLDRAELEAYRRISRSLDDETP